jgi:hypothetical protein
VLGYVLLKQPSFFGRRLRDMFLRHFSLAGFTGVRVAGEVCAPFVALAGTEGGPALRASPKVGAPLEQPEATAPIARIKRLPYRMIVIVITIKLETSVVSCSLQHRICPMRP